MQTSFQQTTVCSAGYKLRNTSSQYLNWVTGCCHVVSKTFGGRTVLRSLFALTHTCLVCRDDMVDLVGSYQFDDQATDAGDVFARDPYILRFRCLNTGRRHDENHHNENQCHSTVNLNVNFCFHRSTEGLGDDPRPHKTR